MMLEILRTEVSGHLGLIREFLTQSEQQPGQPASESLLRAVHTMHGAIAMVDLPSVTPLLAPLEGYIKRLRGQGQAPTAEGLAVIGATADAVEARSMAPRRRWIWANWPMRSMPAQRLARAGKCLARVQCFR
ncbi:MAG: Hpt domain-containing protein [Ahniella sp.]|nr:Hpt domain-containing protein [Ahniella sp.]